MKCLKVAIVASVLLVPGTCLAEEGELEWGKRGSSRELPSLSPPASQGGVAGGEESVVTEQIRFQCSATRCRGVGCGCELLRAGWVERARCSGHAWRYVVQKGNELRLCAGIAARGGFEEEPCVSYREDLSKWACESGR